eukprot:6193695-Pleurochrysis_carterae.AAC.1
MRPMSESDGPRSPALLLCLGLGGGRFFLIGVRFELRLLAALLRLSAEDACGLDEREACERG